MSRIRGVFGLGSTAYEFRLDMFKLHSSHGILYPKGECDLSFLPPPLRKCCFVTWCLRQVSKMICFLQGAIPKRRVWSYSKLGPTLSPSKGYPKPKCPIPVHSNLSYNPMISVEGAKRRFRVEGHKP